MSRNKHMIWIDDNPDRRRTASNLAEVSSVLVDFIDVKNKILGEKLSKMLEGRQPSAVIVDHVLDKTIAENRVFATGSTVAEAIREKWPSCPVVGVTAAEHRDSIDIRTKKTYDELFFFTDFQFAIPQLPVIADDFAQIASSTARQPMSLVRLLKPPKTIS